MLLHHYLAAATFTLLAPSAVVGVCCVLMPATSLAMVAPHVHLAVNPAKLPAIMADANSAAQIPANPVQSHVDGAVHIR